MHVELTKEDVINALLDSNLLIVYDENSAAEKEDIPFLTYLHTENLARVFLELGKYYQSIADDYLKECLKTQNEKFRISKTDVRCRVDIAKLIELRPDLYESFRKPKEQLLRKYFSPWDLFQLLKSAGASEDDIRADEKNTAVTVESVKEFLKPGEAEEILVPYSWKYVVEEV